MTAIDATHAMAAAAPPPAPKAPWRRSLVRTLLYGRNVDRAAKTKARLGLAILQNGEVFFLQVGDQPAFLVANGGQNTDHIDIDFNGGQILRHEGRCQRKNE